MIELSGCISRLSPNNLSSRGSRKDNLYNTHGELSLYGHAFWVEECGGYVPANGHTYVQVIDR